ncbi:MAG: putative cytokinetic ring protein SteA [Ancrocorticia sp.]|nr:putative cytokinetic ring protein SteA [Ancrocorticia sp.]MCI2001300.1 putative cytokinetic ring protein SteA [Ancrocorticia sp.]MCI2012375.1 putative cytokinetic ring protein SteA [Ancrocorticia sp.]MCI2029006.1 putative cytokinetic ring protein SteA [Ancrocorticia sp.]MCI2178827.1 putative cytokinetic ring protein SteA [Ancrocorticia sp.]
MMEHSDHLSGIARVDPRTKNLTKRLQAGDIAVINHTDIDRVSAEALVEKKPKAVLNAAKSTSGRYPNLGPGILHDAGIPLIDDLGSAIMDVREGQRLTFDNSGCVYAGDRLIAQGILQTSETIAADQAAAKAGMSVQLKAFATNTMEYVEHEQDLIFDGVGVPEVKTNFAGRPVLVVVRGYRYKDDLAALRPFIREYHPIMVGVDGGADAILEEGYKLDMIVGDMDSVSDKALSSGAEIVVHAYRDGRAPGKKRVEDLGVPHVVFPCTGTSEDVAMLLADDKGAKLIVAVGTHNTLIEFLDKGRSGMASTFLTRLAIGSKLIDAKGVSQLYRSRVSNWQVFALILAGLIAVAAAIASTAAGQVAFGLSSSWFSDIVHWFVQLF